MPKTRFYRNGHLWPTCPIRYLRSPLSRRENLSKIRKPRCFWASPAPSESKDFWIRYSQQSSQHKLINDPWLPFFVQQSLLGGQRVDNDIGAHLDKRGFPHAWRASPPREVARAFSFFNRVQYVCLHSYQDCAHAVCQDEIDSKP